MFEFNNEEYTLEQIQAAAEQSNMTVDDYIKQYEIKEPGKTTPTSPGADVEETAAPDIPNTELQSGDTSLDLPDPEELTLEEKRNVPFGTAQYLHRNNKKFTKKNVEEAQAKLLADANKTFDERIEDLKNDILGNGVGKFKNLSYNLFGPDGFNPISPTNLPGPAVLSRFQQGITAYTVALDKIYGDKESKKRVSEEFKKLQEIQTQEKAMPSITDGDVEGVLDVFAGIAGDASQVGMSVIPTMIAAGGGALAGGAVGGPGGAAVGGALAGGLSTFAQIAPSFITDYNVEKAKTLYPNLNVDEAVQRLIDADQTEILIPLAGGTIATIPEYVGFKGISKYLMTSTAGKSILKRLARLSYTSGKEGATEVVQLFPEAYNTALAQGKSMEEAAVEAYEYTADNMVKTFVSSTVGTAAFGGIGRGGKGIANKVWEKSKNMRVAIDEGKMEKTIDEISNLNLQKITANTPELKAAIDEKIKTKVEELNGLAVNAMSIFNFAEDKDFDQITNLENLKKNYINKVKGLHTKKETLDPKEYKEALDIYKEKYLEAQARIKGVVNNVSKESNNVAQKVNKIYNEKKKEGAAEIIELYRGMATKIAAKRRNAPKFDLQLLTDEILTGKRGVLDLVNNYEKYVAKQQKANQKVAPLSGFINTNINNRAIEASRRILGTEFETDVTESKKVAATETSEDTVTQQEQAKQEVKKALTQDLNLSEDTQNEIVAAVEKTLGTKLPAVTDKAFKPALTKGFRTELTNSLKKVFGRTASYEQFLRDNFEKIYPAIPQETINKKFKEFNEAVVDPETGKQLRERTAEGKKVFKKRDIAKAEFIKYFLDAPGNVKGARKTSLAEVIADEVGLDNVLGALAKPEVVKKFKAIQELQGQEVPSNFIEIISEKIDRAIDYLDGLQKNNGVLYSSLVIPELSIAAVKAFLKAAKAALKATNSFAKAIKAGIKAAQELFESKQEKDAVATVLTETYKKAEDLGETTFVEQATENVDRELQKIYIPKAAYKLIENLKQSYTENNFDNIEKIKTFILLHSKAIRTVASPSLFQKQMPSLTTNEQLLKAIEIPKSLQNKKAFNLRKEGGGKSIFFGNEKIASPLSLNSEKNNIVKNPDNYIDRIDNQAARYKELLINEIVRLKAIDTNLAKDMLKIMQKDQLSPLRLSGKLGIVFNEGNTTNEHNPPIQSIIELIEDFIDDKASLDSVKKILDNSRQNLVSKDFDKLIPNEFKSKADKARYDKPRKKFEGKYKEYNLPASKSTLDKQYNQLLQATTKVDWTKEFSPVKANLLGRGKGKKFFIPYSADDFVGLLYATLGKGKVGDQQMAWYNENLLRPYSRAIQQYEAQKQKSLREWMALKKQAAKDVPGGLKKQNDSGFTNQDSVRMYIWETQGMEIEGLDAKSISENLEVINNSPKLKEFADRLMSLNPEGYPPPSIDWSSGDITTDLVSYINDVKRSEYLTQWKENVAEIFNDRNKNKLKALYGDAYVKALDNMLYRMDKGRNRYKDASDAEKAFMNWTNNSVGAIMFFNARSAVLQTLSSVNFINFSDNNPINASLAFLNQKQYWNDFSTLFNSDFLKQRRTGLQTDINADEIANAAATSKNKARAVLSAILKFGFTPTQIADSFAIASGGATMYRNRIKKYLKEGLSKEEAETKAFTDFQEIAEETQQSARPDRISMQQAGSLGRLILAFGNTPMQYARLTKKATLDLINGRGDWKTNISKIAYYSVIQNIIFSALQQGMFALLFDDEDDEEVQSRLFRIGNSSADTLLRGIGVYGAAAATVKNMIFKIIEESEKSRPDYKQLAIEATSISPPINSKLRKLESAGKTFTYKQSKEKVFTEGFSLENPAFLAAGKVVSAGTNLPADRVVQKMDHIYTAMQPETELWQGIALSLGWGEWELGMIEKQTKKSPKPTTTFKTKSFQKGFKRKKFKTN